MRIDLMVAMARTKRRVRATTQAETVGDRIRRYRKAKAWTQTQLGEAVGISQRLVAYYEAQGGSPSPDLLMSFAEALGVTTNALLGVDRTRGAEPMTAGSLRLWKRFRRLEQLPEHDRKTVLKMIDTLAENASRKRGA